MPDPTQDQQTIPKPYLPQAGMVQPAQSATPQQPTLAQAGSQAPVPPSAPPAHPIGPAQAKYNTIEEAPPGYAQIKNPFLRGLAKAGSTIAGIAIPKIAPNIPGTEAHHEQILARAGGAVKQEQGAQAATDESRLRNAQAGEAGAAQAHTEAETQNLKNPLGKTKDEEFFKAGDGSYIGYRDAEGKVYGPSDKDLPPGVRAVLEAGKPKPTKATNAFEAWRDIPGNEQKDPLEFVKAEAQAKEQPKEPKTEVRNIMVNGKPHQVMFNDKGEQVKDLGETGETPPKPPVVNVGNQDFELRKTGLGLLDKAEKDYRTATQSADTLASVVKSAQGGNKVSAQAIPLEGVLTITSSQGVHRINRQELEQIAGAGSLFDQIMGKVGKLKEGQPVPPEIQKDFEKLADVMKKGAYSTYQGAHQSAVKRYGLQGEEPLPQPGGSETLPGGVTLDDINKEIERRKKAK